MKTKDIVKKYYLSLLALTLFIGGGCQKKKQEQASTPTPEPTVEATPEPREEIHIFYTSDIHCGVEQNMTLAGVKALVNEAKQVHKYVSLVDMGDFIQGGTMGSLTKGELIISLMNDMEYDMVTLGNHEFDYGLDVLSKLLKEMKFEVIVSNAIYTGKKQNVFEGLPEYIMKEYGGVKIAFLGILTPTNLVTSTPKFFKEDDEFVYNFYSGEDGHALYDKIQSVVDQARTDGADYVIALSHLGSNPKIAPYDSISMIANTTGIDVVLDGHSHSVVIGDAYPNKNKEDVILSSVGTQLQYVGQLIIDKGGKIHTTLIEQTDQRDPIMEEKLANAQEQLDHILSEKVTDLAFDMKIVDENDVRIARTQETTVGNFVADAIRHNLQTDVALINGGATRANLMAGEITVGSLLAVMPFQNHLGSCYVTGQQLLDILEYGVQNTEKVYSFEGNAVGEFGGFFQVSGLKFTIDTSVETPVKMDENSIFESFEGDQRRIKDVYVEENGTYVPLDKEKKYSVGSVSYNIFNDGDGNTLFHDCEPIVETGLVDVEALKEYIVDNGGILDQYRQTEGRITVE